MKKILAVFGVMLMVFALAAPLAVSASNTGDTTITGTVTGVIEVTVPGGFAMPSLVPGTSPESGAKTATVDCNNTAWELDVKGSDNGFMVDSTPTALANAMKIKGGDINDYTALTGSDQSLKTGGAGTTTINDIYFQQTVAWTDAPGSYSITVTFTGTVTTP